MNTKKTAHCLSSPPHSPPNIWDWTSDQANLGFLCSRTYSKAPNHSEIGQQCFWSDWEKVQADRTRRCTYSPRRHPITWAASSEQVTSSMRTMCGFTSSCTCAKSHPGIYSPFKHSIVANDSVCELRRPWSDCAFVQSVLGLRCTHMTPMVHFRLVGLMVAFILWEKDRCPQIFL